MANNFKNFQCEEKYFRDKHDLSIQPYSLLGAQFLIATEQQDTFAIIRRAKFRKAYLETISKRIIKIRRDLSELEPETQLLARQMIMTANTWIDARVVYSDSKDLCEKLLNNIDNAIAIQNQLIEINPSSKERDRGINELLAKLNCLMKFADIVRLLEYYCSYDPVFSWIKHFLDNYKSPNYYKKQVNTLRTKLKIKYSPSDADLIRNEFIGRHRYLEIIHDRFSHLNRRRIK